MSRKQFWLIWAAFLLGLFILLGVYLSQTIQVVNTPPKGPKVVLAIGDEYILGKGASSQERSVAEQFAEKLGWELKVAAKEKLSSIAVHDFIREHRTFDEQYGIALVILGRNDSFYNLPNETSMQRMEFLFGNLLALGVMVVYASAKGEESGWRSLMVKSRARNMGVLVIDDITNLLRDNGELLNEENYPNDEGHAFLADYIYQQVSPHLIQK